MDSIWKEIKNFIELQRYMIGYLTGEYKRNPWCCAPIDPETIPILSSLVRINSLGFVTVVSQPGVTTIWPDCSSEYQRGFMTGFICKQNCEEFMSKLLKIPGIIICKAVLGSGEPPTLYGDYERLIMKRPVERENVNGTSCVAPGTGRFINLTKEIIPEGDSFLENLDEYEKKRLVKIGDKTIRYYTNKWLDYECDETEVLIGVNKALQDYLHDNTYQLTVIRSEYGDADLDTIILEILENLEKKE